MSRLVAAELAEVVLIMPPAVESHLWQTSANSGVAICPKQKGGGMVEEKTAN
jgi:ABC-type Zn uptake system ZnuABC Zn-binding protein ZnuA